MVFSYKVCERPSAAPQPASVAVDLLSAALPPAASVATTAEPADLDERTNPPWIQLHTHTKTISVISFKFKPRI